MTAGRLTRSVTIWLSVLRNGLRIDRVNADVTNNTIINPYSLKDYDPTDPEPADVRDATFGIRLVSGFNGEIRNNTIAVVDNDDGDVRCAGYTPTSSTPYKTAGITGRGIGFSGDSGSLGASAVVTNNNVYGFVDTDGNMDDPLNWGTGLTLCGENDTDDNGIENDGGKCSNNISKDPVFAADTAQRN